MGGLCSEGHIHSYILLYFLNTGLSTLRTCMHVHVHSYILLYLLDVVLSTPSLQL